NDKLVPKEQATVSVFDHGFLYGDGIYETLRVYDGLIFKLDEHLERLERSARFIQLNLPLDRKGFRAALEETLAANNLRDAFVRMMITRGPGEIGLDPALCPKTTFVIFAKPFEEYPEHLFENGVAVGIVKTRRNLPEALNPAIKSTNFLNNILAKIEAISLGVYEGIMCNHDGYVAEGTICNIFMVKNGVVHTAPLSAGILEGVTRKLVLDAAANNGIRLEETLFTHEELYAADECFITNTTMEVMPVSTVDGRTIGDGRPGVLTKQLRQLYRQEVQTCLKAMKQ
ncbi:MAG: branched-chain-amino-acid transaminase, partial [Nitrospirota bacterium]|nr:branched-chain-amino-acid transaminase [Nitrospirota bacterium]